MNEALIPRADAGEMPPAGSSDHLTHVELTHIEKRIENWIRFGQWTHEQLLDQRRRILSFPPGHVFGFIRWASNDFGTAVSRLDIVRTVERGDAYQTLPYVRPGGEILLRTDGWPKVEKVLQHIDAIEAIGIDPADVAPDHWRYVSLRMSVGYEPRLYTMESHQAWLKRQECGQ